MIRYQKICLQRTAIRIEFQQILKRRRAELARHQLTRACRPRRSQQMSQNPASTEYRFQFFIRK